MRPPLTEQQLAFVAAIRAGVDAIEAVKRAGYSASSEAALRAAASRLLRHEGIREALGPGAPATARQSARPAPPPSSPSPPLDEDPLAVLERVMRDPSTPAYVRVETALQVEKIRAARAERERKLEPDEDKPRSRIGLQPNVIMICNGRGGYCGPHVPLTAECFHAQFRKLPPEERAEFLRLIAEDGGAAGLTRIVSKVAADMARPWPSREPDNE